MKLQFWNEREHEILRTRTNLNVSTQGGYHPILLKHYRDEYANFIQNGRNRPFKLEYKILV